MKIFYSVDKKFLSKINDLTKIIHNPQYKEIFDRTPILNINYCRNNFTYGVNHKKLVTKIVKEELPISTESLKIRATETISKSIFCLLNSNHVFVSSGTFFSDYEFSSKIDKSKIFIDIIKPILKKFLHPEIILNIISQVKNTNKKIDSFLSFDKSYDSSTSPISVVEFSTEKIEGMYCNSMVSLFKVLLEEEENNLIIEYLFQFDNSIKYVPFVSLNLVSSVLESILNNKINMEKSIVYQMIYQLLSSEIINSYSYSDTNIFNSFDN